MHYYIKYCVWVIPPLGTKFLLWLLSELTPRGQLKNGCHSAESISKCIFLNKNYHILLYISLNVSPQVQLIISIGSGNSLVPNKWRTITLNNVEPVHCLIYASLTLNELMDSVSLDSVSWEKGKVLGNKIMEEVMEVMHIEDWFWVEIKCDLPRPCIKQKHLALPILTDWSWILLWIKITI